MEDNKSYFGEIGHGLKTLAIGMMLHLQELENSLPLHL